MQYLTKLIVIISIELALFTIAPVCCNAEMASSNPAPNTLSVDLGFDVATGKYGHKIETTTVTVPLALTYYPNDRTDLGISLPYIWQNNGLIVAGKVIGTNVGGVAAKAKDEPVSGVGDLVLTLGYVVFKESGYFPQVHPVADIKVPTADKSLGTGEYDETFGLELSKNLKSWYLFLNGGYTVQGKTKLFKALNYASYDGGIGYEILEALRPSIGFKGTTPTEIKVSGLRQAEGVITYTMARSLDLKFYVDRGFTASSPDWEGGLNLSYYY